MFTIDASITDLQVKERIISRALFSMNSPEIATPELSVEEARCYVFLFREGGSSAAYIALFLPNSDRRFYYASSDNPISEGKVAEVLDEATRFAEQMGFLLDELNLSAMSVDERNQWIEDQPIFGRRKKAEKKTEEQTTAVTPEQPAPESLNAAQKRKQPAASSAGHASMPPVQQEGPTSAEAPDRETVELYPEKPKKPVAAKAPAAHKETALPPDAPAPVQKGANGPGPASVRAADEKQQKPAAKKAAQTTTGTVKREYEALARLLASF